MKLKNFSKLAFLLLLVVLVVSGCSWKFWQKDDTTPPVNGQAGVSLQEKLAAQSSIKKFSDYDALADFLETAPVSDNNYYGGLMKDLSLGAPMASADLGLGYAEATGLTGTDDSVRNSAGSDDYSQTNVQVEGVDEADIIKTDGKYVYALVKNNLYIVNAYPAENAEVLAKIEFKSRPTDVYINGKNLVIFGMDDYFRATPLYKGFRRHSSYTFVKVFDMSDPKNPKQVRDLDIEGNYTDSRMIGDYLYLVTNTYNYNYIVGEPIVPRVVEDGKVLTDDCGVGTRCFHPDVYYFDIPYDQYNFTSVTAINVQKNDQEVNGEVYMLSGNQNMYVSLDNLYITYTKYVSEYDLTLEVLREIVFPRLSAKDQDRINKIEAVENFILSPSEKQRKISVIVENYANSLSVTDQDNLETEMENKLKEKYQDLSKELEKTVIHKIAINKGELEYQATGEVTGQVLNQFSMDERDGYFRIATTKNRTWSQYLDEAEKDSYSNVYVLDKDMKVVGSLEDLAKGERIYSARFMQNRVYLVTFQQIDPFFVIDLADPKNPKVLGELKLPGFSEYLHPYDDNNVIGLGKDTSESDFGRVQTKGIKLTMFDVTDVNNPKEKDTYVMGEAGSDSIALRDHKAFLFSKDKNLLVIPVALRESSNGLYGSFSFSGAAVFKVTADGFDFWGKVDHSDGGKSSNRDYWGGYDYYDNTVKRGLYIDNVLYTMSNNYLKLNKLDDSLSGVKTVGLEKEPSSNDDFVIVN